MKAKEALILSLTNLDKNVRDRIDKFIMDSAKKGFSGCILTKEPDPTKSHVPIPTDIRQRTLLRMYLEYEGFKIEKKDNGDWTISWASVSETNINFNI